MTNSTISCYNQPFDDRPAPPTNGLASNITPTSALISWTPGIGGTPVAYYEIWQAISPGYVAGTSDGNTPWFGLENLAPGSVNFYLITAFGINGQASNPLNIFFITPQLFYTQPYYPPRPRYCPPPQNCYPPHPNCGPYKNSGW
ncbi:fibronectin type III domain-containing protein [Sodalis sp. dw_96]|uniref:fibronectin type III domain-containing protein n=1 Tax=Sodalis sp. dw_96 TaxID=2719794 RepID=UPI001BD2A3C3|nr:fibronectin type III domain-containing protein [Sodalis sp. dw_96]